MLHEGNLEDKSVPITSKHAFTYNKFSIVVHPMIGNKKV